MRIDTQANLFIAPTAGRRSSRRTLFFGAITGLFLAGAVATVGVAGDAMPSAEDRPVQFDSQIRPILSDNCFFCHGPDPETREADLRLDQPEGALGTEDEPGVVVPGSRDESELFYRISSTDEYEQMPPPESGKKLTPDQIELIGRWIDEGAPWESHWAFVPPQRPALPEVQNESWCRNPIDRFILARLESEGLKPSPEAEKTRLLRRVTYDLTGLPPTPEEVDAFLADDSPDAYEKVVDRLLASPHYGEHMARYWLDVARYGDTHGLHLDNYRSMWPYRDWVVKAFNENLPFDQFTVKQLAGDLLPDASLDDKIASGFNRCNITTSEGGAIAEEFLVRYAVDRTKTMGTAWMGLTVGCAVCHDHKYDPISQKEFYQLYAFFYSMADPAMDGNAELTPPFVKVPSPEQAEMKAALVERIAEIDRSIEAELTKLESEYADPLDDAEVPSVSEPQDYLWVDDDVPQGAKLSADGQPWEFVAGGKDGVPPAVAGEKVMRRAAEGLAQHYFVNAVPLEIGKGDVFFVSVYLDPENPPQEIMLQWNDGSWEHRAYWGDGLIPYGGDKDSPAHRRLGDLPAAGEWVRLEVPVDEVGFQPGAKVQGWAFTQHGGTVYWDAAGLRTKTPQAGTSFRSFRRWEVFVRDAQGAGLPKPLADIAKLSPEKRNENQTKQLFRHFLRHVCAEYRERFAPWNEKRDKLQKELDELEKQIPGTLVSADLPKPRQAHRLDRGEYDKPKEAVEPDVLAVLPPMPNDAPHNRLGLARWLVAPEHPLTARVTVNRFWQQVFGTGIVKTAEDFGSQGERPSHPRLLDWLAVEFRESGWDVKHMMRLMVTSATYRQSAKTTPELLAIDPDNRLLARGPRYRMDGEMIRDTALFVSGLLVDRLGGKGVKPYQPSGLWEAVGYESSNTARYVQDHGEALYRRSLYLFWKRTSPPPVMILFDAPSREECVARRPRTNTPLQALALMNETAQVEAARKLAERLMHEGGDTAEAKAAFGFRLVTARFPDEIELAVLLDQYRNQRAYFQSRPEAAEQLLGVGESPRDESLPPVDLAAWTMTANVLLNIDETICK
ncbi:PSD1 and planctomycete cytochrome C domain-containing protein [Thermostilla marina]